MAIPGAIPGATAIPLHYEWRLTHWDTLPERVYSPLFGEAAAPWRLLVFPRGNSGQQVPRRGQGSNQIGAGAGAAGGQNNHVSLYLDAPKAHTVVGRVIQAATFSLALVHPTSPVRTITRATSHAFTSLEWDWGYASMADLGRLRTEGFFSEGDGGMTVMVTGTSLISPQEFACLDTEVPLPVNTPAGMLAGAYGQGLWCDLHIAAAPLAPVDANAATTGPNRPTRRHKHRRQHHIQQADAAGSSRPRARRDEGVEGGTSWHTLEAEERLAPLPGSSTGTPVPRSPPAGSSVGAGGGSRAAAQSSLAGGGSRGTVQPSTAGRCRLASGVGHSAVALAGGQGAAVPEVNRGRQLQSSRSRAPARTPPTLPDPCLPSASYDSSQLRWLPCHKLVLAAASPALRAMLGSGMREGGSSHVLLRDTTPQALEVLLPWLYGCEVVAPAHLLVPLWALGDCYCINRLCNAVQGCVAGLLDSQPQLALELYTTTRHLTPQASPINQVVCEAVERHLPLCAAQPDFQNLAWRHVKRVLAVSWDRYADSNNGEPAWQVPHDMLTVLDAVYAWLQHSGTLLPTTTAQQPPSATTDAPSGSTAMQAQPAGTTTPGMGTDEPTGGEQHGERMDGLDGTAARDGMQPDQTAVTAGDQPSLPALEGLGAAQPIVTSHLGRRAQKRLHALAASMDTTRVTSRYLRYVSHHPLVRLAQEVTSDTESGKGAHDSWWQTSGHPSSGDSDSCSSCSQGSSGSGSRAEAGSDWEGDAGMQLAGEEEPGSGSEEDGENDDQEDRASGGTVAAAATSGSGTRLPERWLSRDALDPHDWPMGFSDEKFGPMGRAAVLAPDPPPLMWVGDGPWATAGSAGVDGPDSGQQLAVAAGPQLAIQSAGYQLVASPKTPSPPGPLASGVPQPTAVARGSNSQLPTAATCDPQQQQEQGRRANSLQLQVEPAAGNPAQLQHQSIAGSPAQQAAVEAQPDPRLPMPASQLQPNRALAPAGPEGYPTYLLPQARPANIAAATRLFTPPADPLLDPGRQTSATPARHVPQLRPLAGAAGGGHGSGGSPPVYMQARGSAGCIASSCITASATVPQRIPPPIPAPPSHPRALDTTHSSTPYVHGGRQGQAMAAPGLGDTHAHSSRLGALAPPIPGPPMNGADLHREELVTASAPMLPRLSRASLASVANGVSAYRPLEHGALSRARCSLERPSRSVHGAQHG